MGTNRSGRALVDYLRQQRAALTEHEPGARAGDPDAVHDMRVATRRLRSTLRTFRPLLDAERGEPLRAELKWLAGLLGAVRDGDVMRQRLAEAVAAESPHLVIGPVAARLDQRFARGAAGARSELVAALDGDRYARLLRNLDELLREPVTRAGPARRLRRRAIWALRRADRRLPAADRTPVDPPVPGPPGVPDRDTRLHEARKAYKQARYAVEVLRPIAGKPARRLAKRLGELQDVLGGHQDAIVTGDLLRDHAMRVHGDGGNTFTYGLLYARQQVAGRDLLRRLPAARARITGRKARGWLA